MCIDSGRLEFAQTPYLVKPVADEPADLRPSDGRALRSFWVPAVAVLAVLPLFLDVSERQLSLLRFLNGATSLNTSVHLAGLMVVIVAMGTFIRFGVAAFDGRLGEVPVFIMAFMMVASILIGLLSGAGTLGLWFFLQAMLPLVAWFIGATRGADTDILAEGYSCHAGNHGARSCHCPDAGDVLGRRKP